MSWINNELRDDIHNLAKEKGWWDNFRSNEECFALIMSELGEMLEAKRAGKEIDLSDRKDWIDDEDWFRQAVKDTVGDELADVLIRLLDYLGNYKISISPQHIPIIRARTLWGNTFGEDTWILMSYLNKIFHNEQSCHWYIVLLLKFAEKWGIDLEAHVTLKHEYNKTRPIKHNKQF